MYSKLQIHFLSDSLFESHNLPKICSSINKKLDIDPRWDDDASPMSY